MASKRKNRAASSPLGSARPSEQAEAASLRSNSETRGNNETDIAYKKRRFNEQYDTNTASNEDILQAQMLTWSSQCYDHFVVPPTIVVAPDGAVKYRFYCKKFITRARYDTSTGNLTSHVGKCDPTVAKGRESIAAFAHGSIYTKAQFRYLIMLWISTCHRPFAIIEDKPLQDIFHMLYDPVEIPSAVTVSRDIKEVFQITKKSVAAFLASLSSAIHIQFDGWTSPNVISFLGVVVAFEREGSMQSFTLDLMKLRKSHTGENLAQELHKCLKSFGISKKILGQVCDNASNNDTMITALERLLDSYAGPHTRVRCFCHILNLCVKAILKQFSQKKNDKANESEVYDEDDIDIEEDTGDNEDEYELDDDQAVDDERVIEEIEDDIAINVTSSERAIGCFAVAKIRGLAKRVFNSPTLTADLADACEQVDIPSKKMVRAVDTRWNTVVEMINRALNLRSALDLLVDQHKNNRTSRIYRFKLTEQEWDILEQLMPMLEYFLEATKQMSTSSFCLLHEVIPYFDGLEAMLKDTIDNAELHSTVRVAAQLGRAVLNKYYAKTDDSIMYRCALILHPCYKLEYFRTAGWPREWIDAAVKCVTDVWREHYKPAEPATMSMQASTSQATSTKTLKYFAGISSFGKTTGRDQLDDYLNSPTIAGTTDPLKWWANQDTPLARMALDFLSTPASSTDVERTFSHGGLVVSKRRHNLSDESTRAAIVLNSWASVPGLIPKDDIVKMFDDKSKRPRRVDKAVIVLEEDEA